MVSMFTVMMLVLRIHLLLLVMLLNRSVKLQMLLLSKSKKMFQLPTRNGLKPSRLEEMSNGRRMFSSLSEKILQKPTNLTSSPCSRKEPKATPCHTLPLHRKTSKKPQKLQRMRRCSCHVWSEPWKASS